MPKVAVTVVQTETNFTFTATTNEDGLYRVPSLQVGTYRITFEAPGFKKVINDKVDLRTGDVLAVDATMQVGSVTEQIEVSAASALLETETSATGAIIEGSVLYHLPPR